jgi:hypothetical protein
MNLTLAESISLDSIPLIILVPTYKRAVCNLDQILKNLHYLHAPSLPLKASFLRVLTVGKCGWNLPPEDVDPDCHEEGGVPGAQAHATRQAGRGNCQAFAPRLQEVGAKRQPSRYGKCPEAMCNCKGGQRFFSLIANLLKS